MCWQAVLSRALQPSHLSGLTKLGPALTLVLTRIVRSCEIRSLLCRSDVALLVDEVQIAVSRADLAADFHGHFSCRYSLTFEPTSRISFAPALTLVLICIARLLSE
jgi:hypothetical protein